MVLIKPGLYIITDGEVAPDYPLLVAMCLMQVAVSVTSPYFMTLNAAGIVKYQIVTYAIYAAVSLPLKFLLGSQYGMIAITWVGVVTYVLLLTVPTVVRSMTYLKQKQPFTPNAPSKR